MDDRPPSRGYGQMTVWRHGPAFAAACATASFVAGRRWDVLAWNRPAAELLGFDRLAAADRNILVTMLTNPRARGS